MTPFSSAGTLSRPCAAARFHMSTTFCMNYFSSRFFFARSLSPVSFAVPMSAIMVWCSHIADGNVVAHNLPDMTNASRKNADTNTILVGNTRALMLNFPRSSFGFHTRMHCSDGSGGGGCQWMKMTEWMNYAVCLSARPCRAFKFTVFVCFRNYLWYGMSFGVVKVVNVCVRHASGGSHRIRTARITEWMENNNFSKMWDKKKMRSKYRVISNRLLHKLHARRRRQSWHSRWIYSPVRAHIPLSRNYSSMFRLSWAYGLYYSVSIGLVANFVDLLLPPSALPAFN